jgi:fibro-slime domain-containing protein
VRALLLGVAVTLVGCGSESLDPPREHRASNRDAGGGSGAAAGAEDFLPDASGAINGASCAPNLAGTARDFKGANEQPGGHPDFEGVADTNQGSDTGIVKEDLGADLKPVYAGSTKSTSGQVNFDQWFRDTPGVNKSKVITLPFVFGPGDRVTYDSTEFFPLDSDPDGFGNTPGQAHDFSFTFELHTEFVYEGGEVFEFRGDDDVFVFINQKLVADLGGVHSAESATVDVDKESARLGITKGQTYPFAFFFAERHTSSSNFRFETTLKFSNCNPILPK